MTVIEHYPWLKVAPNGEMSVKIEGSCTPVEAERRMTIFQEIRAERLVPASQLQGAVKERDDFRQAVIDALDADLISDGARINAIRERLGLPSSGGQSRETNAPKET